MRLFNFIGSVALCLVSLSSFADGELEIKSCYDRNDAFCKVYLEKKSENDTGYEVNLIDSISNKLFFPYSDFNTVMESVSFYKVQDRYVFLKEYLDSTKAKEFITFHYNRPFIDMHYYYIESSINPNERKREWSGQMCDSDADLSSPDTQSHLLEVMSSRCMNEAKLPSDKNYNVGNDVFFPIAKFFNGKFKNNMKVVALDSKNQGSININDLACSANCDLITNSANYIGKLNGKIRVKLHLDFDDNIITGYYYYDKIKKNIKITGVKDGNSLNLVADVQGGKEQFNGVINDGQFKGKWINAAENKMYPFSFYLMLIQ